MQIWGVGGMTFPALCLWHSGTSFRGLTSEDCQGSNLFCSFPDQEVRRMAVQWIGSLSDSELLDYLPQLVQV